MSVSQRALPVAGFFRVSLSTVLVLFCLHAGSAVGQGVFERGTFVTLPAGKHVNHVYQSTWNTYFAVEDGVLVFDHHNQKWLEPITASNGLTQYPALLVWQDLTSMEVWIVTPDYLFIYDHGSGWMQREPLPQDPAFTGAYSLGITPQRVLISAAAPESQQTYSAVFLRSSGKLERWEADSSLGIDWNQVTRYDPESVRSEIGTGLLTDQILGGGFDADGRIRLDGYPLKTGAEVSSSATSSSGEAFLGTQGLGVFYRPMRGGSWKALPFGLLSPDVMSLSVDNKQLLVGGRAGLTLLDGFEPVYEEAISDPVLDYSFVSAIATSPNLLFVAGRGGVFKRNRQAHGWSRLVKKEDLKSKRIYSLASGSSGNLMIGTDQNAFIYHTSGLILKSVFPQNSSWTVYHTLYSEGTYYLATVFGLYKYEEAYAGFSARINSQGQQQSPHSTAAVDPIYRAAVSDSVLWATTSRGLISVDLASGQGQSFLSPYTPFQPRGLVVLGRRVWIGSESGLYSFDPRTQAWRQYTSNDGLISNFITDLAGQGDYIWVGSNLGLTRVTWRNLH